MTVKEKALEYHKKGFNCAQCVLCALGDYTGMDEKTALAIAGGFGGGLRCGEVCGSVSGAVMAVGLCCRFDDEKNEQVKKKIAELAKAACKEFKGEFGKMRCLDLKRAKKSCDELIAGASEIAERIIIEYNNSQTDREEEDTNGNL